MSEKKKVLIFIGDEKCGACSIFRKAWDEICKNENFVKYFHMITFMGNGAVGKIGPGEKLSLLPPAFEKYNMLPTLLIVTEDEYNKRWDLETGQVINQNLPLTGKTFTSGIVVPKMVDGKITSVPNIKGVADWIYRNR